MLQIGYYKGTDERIYYGNPIINQRYITTTLLHHPDRKIR